MFTDDEIECSEKLEVESSKSNGRMADNEKVKELKRSILMLKLKVDALSKSNKKLVMALRAVKRRLHE